MERRVCKVALLAVALARRTVWAVRAEPDLGPLQPAVEEGAAALEIVEPATHLVGRFRHWRERGWVGWAEVDQVRALVVVPVRGRGLA